ncbi:MAG: hypothetical protein C4345_13315, partial [Chloroflexota bacterium]
QDWLDKKVRRGASYRLHSLREIEKLDPARLTDEQKRLARLWSCLSEARNSLAHAGMDGEPVDLTQGKLGKNLAEVKQGWSWLTNDPAVPLSSAGPDHVMVSPLGRMPGALYTALRKYPQVERCLVITSAEAEGNLTNLGVRLGRPVVFETIRLADPLAGVSELKEVISQARPHLLDAARVYVHLTGGS